MHLKLAFVLLVIVTALVSSEPPPENYGNNNGGWRQQQQQTKIKQSGPSKIFGWLGSRFAKIPYFFPKIPPFPKYQVPHKLPSYQAAIVLPQHPATEYQHGHAAQSPPEKVVITQNHDEGHYEAAAPQQDAYHEAPQQQYYQEPQAPVYNDIIPEFKVHSSNDIDVVQSQLISYNKEIIPPNNAGWQDANTGNGGYADQGTAHASTYPVSAPPLYNNIPRPPSKSIVKHVPVVPHSTGPDYFNTAYDQKQPSGNQGAYSQGYNPNGFYQTQSYSQEVTQPRPTYSSPAYQTIQSPEPAYQAVKSQQFSYSDAMTPQRQAQQAYSVQQSYTSQGSYAQQGNYAAPQANYAAPAASQGSYAASQGNYAAPSPSPKPAASYQAPHSAANGFKSSGIPGVQILSQSDDSGNPVFEVLADADAPDFNGHPFDINKLIAMIEPGAQLAGAPELSQAASETQNVYQTAPSSGPASGGSSGTGDLLLSESNPQPALSSPGTKPKPLSKKPIYSFLPKSSNESLSNESSSLKEIMKFFQQTGGKGYIVVEKKRSRPNLTLTTDHFDFPDDEDDELADGISRVNITSETIPFFTHDNDFVDQDPFQNQASPTRYTYPTVPKSPMPLPLTTDRPSSASQTVSPTTANPSTSSTPTPVVFFAVRATTRHPNHNYDPNSSHSVGSADSGKGNNFNSFLDTVGEDDMSFAESNIKSIAITVTPPTRKPATKQRSTTSTTAPSVVAQPVQPVVATATNGLPRSAKRPAPVYKVRAKN